MATTTATVDTEQIKSAIDLRELVSSCTELHRESATEQAGPCPKCGGTDRLRVAAAWWFCRQCHPKRADAIEFMTWLHGYTFREAAAILQGHQPPTTTERRRPQARRPQAAAGWNAEQAANALAGYQRALWDDANTLAHDYLEQRRGLTSDTWLTYGLGYRHDTPLPNTWDAAKRSYSHPAQPAIVIPWYRRQELIALRYRFLQPHTYTGIDGKERTEKQTSRGAFHGALFGGQALARFCEAKRLLIICEGELNAMSIYQVTHHTAADVVSLGSESQHLTPAMVDYARQFRRVMLWADRAGIAEQLQAAIPNAFAITSEMCGGKDANDLLQANHLGGYLSAWRFQMCETPAERVALYYDLWDDANALQGIDAGSRAVMEQMRP